METKYQEIVEECLELLRQGRSVEECLSRHPDEAIELEPMLHAAVSARSNMAAELPVAARNRMKSQVMAEWDRRHQPGRWSSLVTSFFAKISPIPKSAAIPRWAFASAILVVALALGGLGTSTAAANTVPGDMLYPVKEMREGVELWLARSPEDKVEMYTTLVKERVDEVKKIADREQADLDSVSDALARMEGHLTALNMVVDDNLTDRAVDEVNPGFVEALQQSIIEQGAAGGVLETAFEKMPTEDRPDFGNALKAIQLAQDRVDSALETVGQSGFNGK